LLIAFSPAMADPGLRRVRSRIEASPDSTLLIGVGRFDVFRARDREKNPTKEMPN
jgi:hypothetical protein